MIWERRITPESDQNSKSQAFSELPGNLRGVWIQCAFRPQNEPFAVPGLRNTFILHAPPPHHHPLIRRSFLCVALKKRWSARSQSHNKHTSRAVLGELTAQVGISEFSRKEDGNTWYENERVCGQVSYET